MTRIIDALKFNTIDEVKDYLLGQQVPPLSEEKEYTLRILLALSQNASNDDLKLIREVQTNLEINRILLKDLAGLFDYPPYPKLQDFAHELSKDSRELQAYVRAFDKDPVDLRAPTLNKNRFVSKTTLTILKEQFDIDEVKRVVAEIRSVTDGSSLSARQQFNLVQQVIYINAIGKDFPLNVANQSVEDLTSVSRATLRRLSDALIAQVKEPLLGSQIRLKAQLNLLAVMREQYYRCSGVFLNSTQIMSLLLTINNFQYHQFIDVPSEADKDSLRVFLAALQWVHARDSKTSVAVRTDLEIERAKSKSSSDFYTFMGIPSMPMDNSESIHQVTATPLELIGLGSRSDVNFAYRIPAHKKGSQESAEGSLINHPEYLSKIKEALRTAKDGQPILLIAKNAAEVVALTDLLEEFLRDELDDEYTVETFTGTEPEKVRRQWLKDKAGKTSHLTITTPFLAGRADFDTDYKEGFLAIQTYIGRPNENRKIIEQFSREKPVQYIALYEDNGSIESCSDSFVSKRGKEVFLEALAARHRLNSEEAAVKQYYQQSASTIQQVVLRQFDEWKAFLHLVYPHSEWKVLDSQLSVQRKALVDLLDQEWTRFLTATDPMHVYASPYIRRNEDNKLETAVLDLALDEYGHHAEALWSAERGQLKSKVEGRIAKGSVNALRCQYLEQIELNQQLKLHKLEVRANKKSVAQEEKKARKAVESALDVYGALLKYSDDTVSSYRQPFIQNQIKLLANDLGKKINQTSLGSGVKAYLCDQVNKATSFRALALVLIEYDQLWKDKDKPTEKYRMQPVITELLRVHQQSGVGDDAELQRLKALYLDNVATDIVDQLEEALSWAKEENRGFLYWIERTAVKEAAQDLLNAVEGVKRSRDPVLQQAAIKNLYKKLNQHQAQLEDLWIFSFGHKNTRDLINQTLATLNDVTVMGSGRDELDAHFINECKEEAHSHVIKQKFKTALRELEALNAPWLAENKEWQAITDRLRFIQGKNASLYAIDEMYHFVNSQSKSLAQSTSPIFAPLIQLRGTLRTLWNDIEQKHSDLLQESGHFDLKAKQIKEQLRTLKGFTVKSVELRTGSTGFADYYDLLIKGTGSHPLLNKFTSYNSPLGLWTKEIESLSQSLDLLKVRRSKLIDLKEEQLPLLKSAPDTINLALFSDQHQDKIRKIVTLKEYAEGKVPTDLSAFSKTLQDAFFDRNLLKNFKLDSFTLAQVARLKDERLKEELTELYRKMHPETDPAVQNRTWYQRIASYLTSPFSLQESAEDWAYQLTAIKNSVHSYVVQELNLEIVRESNALDAEIADMYATMGTEIQSLAEQVTFLQERITEEQNKGNAMVRRFNSMSDVYDFEAELYRDEPGHQILETSDDSFDFDSESDEEAASSPRVF
ncbi:hypothetical protein [Legionella shakespearei]|uniref:LigA, interaptin n=1 Tax=Legionella shakespearei DSM 23087 TaxID=1122169 RepID=A0A0W0YMU2_9GAMM|nr:hypothetical protein [Legionella shakespearei]KTD57859.1 LigA, interaptin [Legionella shakespearei DSM 23087]